MKKLGSFKNFICPECNKSNRIFTWDGEFKKFLCSCGGTFVENVPKTNSSFFICREASLSPSERQALLRKRSRAHYRNHQKKKSNGRF